jgi:uncharacterized protein YjbI with pentapeptide repeats
MNTTFDAREYFDHVFNKLHLESSEILNGVFTDCIFDKCSFVASVFNNCRFTNCTFKECDLSLIQISGSSFPSTNFEQSKIIGVDWTRADWSSSGFSSFKGFCDCIISHSTFIGLDLKGIQINNCVANDVDFRDANLSKVDFTGTDLARCIFGNTNLSAADLSQARNYDIDPGNNHIKGAKFSLPEAMALLYSMDIILNAIE